MIKVAKKLYNKKLFYLHSAFFIEKYSIFANVRLTSTTYIKNSSDN